MKPNDWVDDATIDDPDASKPEDWDENAPKVSIDTIECLAMLFSIVTFAIKLK
jgi:hypothetical protein